MDTGNPLRNGCIKVLSKLTGERVVNFFGGTYIILGNTVIKLKVRK